MMKVAVIGTGISGLSCASILSQQFDVTVYEKSDDPGGHSRTRWVNTPEAKVPVDTGFIVFNKKNYPLLTTMFEALKVPVVKSNMSFGVSANQGTFEYGSTAAKGLFAQPSNALKFSYWKMLLDILKFNREAHRFLNASPEMTLGQCLEQMGLGRWFKEYYLLAMGACIWSTPLAGMLDFPASTFLRFFDNHGLLTVKDHPQWYTVEGGSRVYVNKILEGFSGQLRLGCGVVNVDRRPDGVIIHDSQGAQSVYDKVIFSCHADQALALLAKPSEEEKRILSAFRYQTNRVVLHRDISLMPKRRRAWSSWVYRCDGSPMEQPDVSLTYWMNNLQPLPTTTQILVTLNPSHAIAEELIEDVAYLEHPIFDRQAIQAQTEMAKIQGRDRIWYCGAYQRYGFHEDGLMSAVAVAQHLGVEPEWLKSC